MRLRIIQAIAFGLACQLAHGAPLSALEKKITRLASAQDERAIALTQRLVDINSGTRNLKGVETVGRIMIDELSQLGFAARWVPMSSVGRAGHVVAEHVGNGQGRRILLIGHLDTVFEPDSPFQHFVRRGDTAEGPGVNDMKGGLAIMVSALRTLKDSGALTDATVTVVLSGDEESAGAPINVSRADLINAASHSDVALEFEPLSTQNGHDMGSVSRRSSSTWTVRTKGRAAHSAGIFSNDVGYGAAYELSRILDAFRRDAGEPNATYNVGLLLAGGTTELRADEAAGSTNGKANIVAGEGFARGDLRTLSNEQTARIEARMSDIVQQHLPGTEASIEFNESYPAMPPTPGNRALLVELNKINRSLGLEVMQELDPLQRGAGDISFVADRVDGLVGFGVAGEGSHAPGETVDLKSFDRQIKRTALLIERLSKTPR